MFQQPAVLVDFERPDKTLTWVWKSSSNLAKLERKRRGANFWDDVAASQATLSQLERLHESSRPHEKNHVTGQRTVRI